MRLEPTPLLRELPDPGEREDLKPAAIGQNRPLPTGKPVQSARLIQRLGPRPQVEVVGISQNDLRPDLLPQVAVKNPFDAPHRPHRHENRGADFAVVGPKGARPGGGVRVGMFEGKTHGFLLYVK